MHSAFAFSSPREKGYHENEVSRDRNKRSHISRLETFQQNKNLLQGTQQSTKVPLATAHLPASSRAAITKV